MVFFGKDTVISPLLWFKSTPGGLDRDEHRFAEFIPNGGYGMAVFACTAAWILSALINTSCNTGFSGLREVDAPRTATVRIENQFILFQEGDREANLALVSTGRPPHFSTPTGDFRVLYRLRNPISSTYNVRMPYWLCIVPSGAIGLHQAGGNHAESRLGEPLSHGCIRLGRFTAEWAYNWMPTGAGVRIH